MKSDTAKEKRNPFRFKDVQFIIPHSSFIIFNPVATSASLFSTLNAQSLKRKGFRFFCLPCLSCFPWLNLNAQP